MEILQIIIWPLLVLILFIIFIFLFYKPIKSLITRVKTIKGGNYGIETIDSVEEKIKLQEKSELPNKMTDISLSVDKDGLSKISKSEELEKVLNLFSDETRSFFQTSIQNETELNSISDDKEKIDTLFKYSEVVYIKYLFGNIYQAIFGSQIKLLRHLNSATNETIDSVKTFYDEAVSKNPNLKSYPYENYIEFLSNVELVNVLNKKISITTRGRDFLKYVVEMGLPEVKFN
ncbi:MAG TPA: hypothetical protein VHP32_07135 [Ignavibacteria bacterium]|nr:hypothetical protein [Ignavibacteria bacterium]